MLPMSARYRSPSSDDYVNGYLSREQYNGYINNDDRVLLKVLSRASNLILLNFFLALPEVNVNFVILIELVN